MSLWHVGIIFNFFVSMCQKQIKKKFYYLNNTGESKGSNTRLIFNLKLIPEAETDQKSK